jgi:hypothetical protein
MQVAHVVAQQLTNSTVPRCISVEPLLPSSKV